MKWTRSFLLHPWLNRFNLLYLFGGLVGTLAAPGDLSGEVLLAALGGEILYLIVRGFLDRSEIPALHIRRLPFKERARFLQLWQTTARVEADFERNKHHVGAMAAGVGQAKRLLHAYLDLALAARRIDHFVLSRRVNFDAEIADAEKRLETADEREKELLRGNLSVLQKRRETYRELADRRRNIDHRLKTIENAIELLGEIGVGLVQPEAAADQVKAILANVEDAESFMSELNQVITPLRVKA
jgi:hypothetical protein